jgi:hypothetical protein
VVDSDSIEPGHEWPRCYSPAHFAAIAQSLGRATLPEIAIEDLQEAVERYQWASLVDDCAFSFSTNKGRRQQLLHIIKL